jgi:hypothetical protein
MVTDKNKEQFEKWLVKYFFHDIHFNSINDVIGLDILPFEMRVGVYLRYYKEVHNLEYDGTMDNARATITAYNELVNNNK